MNQSMTFTIKFLTDFSRPLSPTEYCLRVASEESHLREFMTAAEPVQANGEFVKKLTGRELRRAFYGYFRLSPGTRPDRSLDGFSVCNMLLFPSNLCLSE